MHTQPFLLVSALALTVACSKAAPPPQVAPSPTETPTPAPVASAASAEVPEATDVGPGPTFTDIQQAISEINTELRQCYIAGTFKNSQLEGTVIVTFTIETSGEVSSAIDSGSSLQDPDVVRCVLGEFADLRFSPGGQSATEVTYAVPFRQRG